MTSIPIDGRLYRVFEGTVLEGVVTNHIDGGFSGPIMVASRPTSTPTTTSSFSCRRVRD